MTMRYGFYLPTRGPLATRDGVLGWRAKASDWDCIRR